MQVKTLEREGKTHGDPGKAGTGKASLVESA
jgi:hypothetical protein